MVITASPATMCNADGQADAPNLSPWRAPAEEAPHRGASLWDHRGCPLCAPPLFGHGMALFAAGDGRTGARMGEQESGSVLGETTMIVCRLIAGLIGLPFVAVAAMALLGMGAEVRAELAPTVAKENPPGLVSSDGWACAREPWPYGCQWQAPPVKRVFVRPSQPF